MREMEIQRVIRNLNVYFWLLNCGVSWPTIVTRDREKTEAKMEIEKRKKKKKAKLYISIIVSRVVRCVCDLS